MTSLEKKLEKQEAAELPDNGWIEDGTGSWAFWSGGRERAVTLYTGDGRWRSIWIGARDKRARHLRERYDTAAEAIKATDTAILAGDNSPLWLALAPRKG